MNQIIKVTRKAAQNLINATYPQYTGRKVKVEFSTKITFYDTNFGGGTRNTYTAVASDGRSAKMNVPAPWINPIEGMTVEITPAAVIVEHSMFCGQDMGITIHAHPCYAPMWLNA